MAKGFKLICFSFFLKGNIKHTDKNKNKLKKSINCTIQSKTLSNEEKMGYKCSFADLSQIKDKNSIWENKIQNSKKQVFVQGKNDIITYILHDPL